MSVQSDLITRNKQVAASFDRGDMPILPELMPVSRLAAVREKHPIRTLLTGI